MEMKPLYNQILILPVEVSGILKDPNNPSFAMYAKVEAIGPDVKTVQEGDTIAFLVWGLNHTEVNGKKYYFIADEKEFLLAKVENYEACTPSPLAV